MARMFGNRAMPIDTPVLLRPGTMHREADCHANASNYALPPEHPERAAKGDLGLTIIPGLESKALEHSESPFANLRKGK